jgi:hypothetical protein
MVPANLSGDCSMMAKSAAVITAYKVTSAPAIFRSLLATEIS